MQFVVPFIIMAFAYTKVIKWTEVQVSALSPFLRKRTNSYFGCRRNWDGNFSRHRPTVASLWCVGFNQSSGNCVVKEEPLCYGYFVTSNCCIMQSKKGRFNKKRGIGIGKLSSPGQRIQTRNFKKSKATLMSYGDVQRIRRIMPRKWAV